jgi:1-aminocyclopropane-1-carboxylate deaminase/D-cysteine desulfhydrase-like pyridoxal-dependent ACC family enzyme
MRLSGSQISGNKARKMLSLHCLDPVSFPSCIVSFGGPQSNSMLALAAVVQYQNTLLLSLVHENSNNTDTITTNNTTDPVTRQQSPPPPLPNKRFVYYTKKLPRFLQNQPSGNLFRALSLGMELIELSNEDYNNLFGSAMGGTGTGGGGNSCVVDEPPARLTPPVYGDSVWIPQGGASRMAVGGTQRLAQEIYDYWLTHGSNQPLSVCFPGGTCSTALLVHRALQHIQLTQQPNSSPLDIEVVVVPCVGDDAYAKRQMMNLHQQLFGSSLSSPIIDSAQNIPAILRPTPIPGENSNNNRNSIENGSRSLSSSMDSTTNIRLEDVSFDYFRFGEPDANILQTFLELRDEYDLVVDLLYGAPAWTLLFRHWTSTSSVNNSFNPNAPIDGRRIMYVHSGGLEGISSQLLRYKYKNLIHMDEIQLPGRNGH